MSTKRKYLKKTGILSNGYIPPISPALIAKELNKLSTESLFDLVELWTRLSVTQPKVTTAQRKEGIIQLDVIRDFQEVLHTLRAATSPKRKLIDRLLVEFYPNGLNALQLAQIDIQLLVDKPTGFSWVSSTAKIMTNSTDIDDEEEKQELDEFIFSLDSQSFLDRLIESLSSLYLTHIYISRHPQFHLIIVRLQMYEYVHLKKPSTGKASMGNKLLPDILSRKPYYLAIPTSSPNLIHSASNADDLVSKLILQAVELTLSSPFRQIKLFKNNEAPVRTLQAMHILKGVSRFGQSLGSWAPYADGTVDISPLGDITNHKVFNPIQLKGGFDGNKKRLSKEDEELEHRKRVANLKFKGSMTPLKSKVLYETTKVNTENEDGNDDKTNKNDYSSLVPIQYGEFKIENKIEGSGNNDAPSIRLRLLGNDIFAGLHELAVKGIVDPELIPSWMTGEEGVNIGVVKDGDFTSRPFDR
ncbi:hypothetical protein CANARDRAFT_194018 [[Candida] arabinofermentans NRRL YB-2248]|uniref:CHL4 family chromosome segregation protein n=1 Tax=[Candida] arabinofermentans NRRL YB-2248 TaxID=983967 RepID=A0A1E4T945_9ASCO|nr:hypothetical protein CANARDRAFT_194018 [[Candida] arabinofermentans NRRL YB-2248]